MSLNSKEVAKHFFTEMAEWERWCLSIERSDETSTVRREKLEAIFKKYLSKKALEKGQSRCEILMFGEPPEYDIQISEVEEISDKKHFVYAKGGGWEPEKRYLFVKENEEWRTEYREYLNNSGKWNKEREF